MKTDISIKPCVPTWRLADDERDALLHDLLKVEASPYTQPRQFMDSVGSISAAARSFCTTVSRLRLEADLDENPLIYIKNLPVEQDLPIFGHDEPVRDKYVMKSTFVTEALLLLFSLAARTPIVAYRTINNGDLFHDVYLKESLKHTASQKSMVSFGFHYDMGFKRVRPDWANLACLRSSRDNCVSTSLCRNIDILKGLSADDLTTLQRPIYTTPPEVVSSLGSEYDTTPQAGPIYFPNRPWKFEYFEGRTETSDAEGAKAILRLNAVMHKNKQHLVLEPGELAAISNNHSIHCREVLEIGDLDAHRIRWLIKTYNVEDLARHQPYLMPGSPYTADE